MKANRRPIGLALVTMLTLLLGAVLVPTAAHATGPLAVEDVTATASGSTIHVSWTEADQSNTIGYRVTPRIGSTEQTSLAQNYWVGTDYADFTGLTKGQSYTFVVDAYASAGSDITRSAPSNAASWYSTPSAPTSVSAGAVYQSATSVDVSWTAPTDNGGGALSYTVTASPGGASVTTSSTTATITGLSPNTSYTFTVKATNPGGLHNSATSSSVTTNYQADAVTGVTANANGSDIDVSWTETDLSNTIGYRVTPYIAGVAQTALAQNFWVGTDHTSFSGLTQGQSYTFVVQAWSSVGSVITNSAPSNAAAWYSTPSAPTSISASPVFQSATTADVSWTAPSSNGGGSLSYTVTASPGGASVTTSSTTATVTGLSPNTSYTFTVKATNPGGLHNSATSSSVTTNYQVLAVTGVTAAANGSDIDVTWTETDLSNTIGYRVTPYIAGVAQTALAQNFWVGTDHTSFSGLTKGQSYTFVVQAWSSVGSVITNSAPSNAAAWYGTPTAPTGVTGTAVYQSATSVDVSWTAPTDNGGGALSYTVTASPGGASVTTSSTTATITGLSPNTSYTFTVKATNPGGLHNSATSSSVTTNYQADAVTGVTANANGSDIDVSWTETDLSNTIGYRVTPYIAGVAQTALAQNFWVGTDHTSFSGLTQGQSYTFVVQAWSTVGSVITNSAPSNAASW